MIKKHWKLKRNNYELFLDMDIGDWLLVLPALSTRAVQLHLVCTYIDIYIDIDIDIDIYISIEIDVDIDIDITCGLTTVFELLAFLTFLPTLFTSEGLKVRLCSRHVVWCRGE